MTDDRQMVESAAFDALRAINDAIDSDRMIGWLPECVVEKLAEARAALGTMFTQPEDASGSQPPF